MPTPSEPSFAEKVIAFNAKLHLDVKLPEGIRVMNPFKENPEAFRVSSAFYRKFYNDHRKRYLILGINPGRFGAGVTGVPFTDTKRMEEKCGLSVGGQRTHEPSSVFVYEVIEAYGGVEAFYRDFYINSPSPLGFVKRTPEGKEVNFNYYDSRQLQNALEEFMTACIQAHIEMGTFTDKAFCMGSGKNHAYLSRLNARHGFFDRLIPLEHPRYVMQYQSKHKAYYLEKYLRALRGES